MKAFTFVILALITLSYAQDNNCQTKTASGCSNCWSGFFIGPLGVCKSIPVGANCNTYNMTTGDCLNCWSNDVVVSGVCVAASSASTTIQNPNCATSNTSTGACISCWQGFYFSNGQCLQGNPLCKTFDNSGTGACGSCWGSSYYLAANGQCIQGNGLCATYTNTGLCATCWASSYYYINAVGLCALVSGTCKTWDPNTGNCLSCWWGTAHNLTCY